MWWGERGELELVGLLCGLGVVGLEDCVDVLCGGVDVPLGWRRRLGGLMGGVRRRGLGVRFDRVGKVYFLEGGS